VLKLVAAVETTVGRRGLGRLRLVRHCAEVEMVCRLHGHDDGIGRQRRRLCLSRRAEGIGEDFARL